MTYPQTAALQTLLERVEAGAYDRPDGRAKRYCDFSNDLLDAGVRSTDFGDIVAALKSDTASAAIRALIADTEGR